MGKLVEILPDRFFNKLAAKSYDQKTSARHYQGKTTGRVVVKRMINYANVWH